MSLSILIFVASPLDYARYRHAALHIHGPPPSLAEVTGTTGFYSYSERENYEIPTKSTSIARIIPVPELSPDERLREIIAETPIPNTLDDWNSQDWVCDVLERLVRLGYLRERGKDQAVDGMVSAVLEAGDEV